MINKFLSTLVLMSSLFAQSKQLIIDNSASFVEYDGSHFLHNWTGRSSSINGTILIEMENPNKSTIEVSIPVFSFDSNNGNRDSNMLHYVEEHLFPEVKFNSKSIIQIDKTSYNLEGDLIFHGISKELTMPVTVIIDSVFASISSSFEVNLNEFDVDRPKLMLTPINEIIKIRIQIQGELKE